LLKAGSTKLKLLACYREKVNALVVELSPTFYCS
jgi:hypothetical protein